MSDKRLPKNKSSNNRMVKPVHILMALCLVAMSINETLYADDTEIYQATYDETTAGRPKVLIVIDDSGSMDAIVPNSKPKYDPLGTYTTVDPPHPSDRIYWSTNSTPPSKHSSQWFLKDRNRCASSYDSLNEQGYIQTKARHWNEKNTATKKGQWSNLSASSHYPMHVECKADLDSGNADNGPNVDDGFPKDNVPNSEALGAATTDQSTAKWDKTYTFYSAHYMDYWYDTGTKNLTRMEIAQNVIGDLIQANKGIDFGLAEFNSNWSSKSSDGGRIVRRIIENMTATQRTEIVDMVNTMTPAGSTPLCEATYEVYRYLAGKPVKYGENGYYEEIWNGSRGYEKGDILKRDMAAESGGNYISPATDCAHTYVVIMTDGEPQNDTAANSAIEMLTGKTCQEYATSGQGMTKNCLPQLAEYMANTDLDNDTTNGNQYGITYTIGFTTKQDLLRDTAIKGKGEYFTADTADELTEAFRAAILGILSKETTFTSPAVAVDTFNRTQSREEVFYAMFKPNEQTDWPGNIKKLKILMVDGVATLVDKNGVAAIDPQTGFIKDDATTFWSTTVDGPRVLEGGVGGLLAARDPSTRVIYSNTGTGGTLQAFNNTNMVPEAFGFDEEDDETLFDYFDVDDQAQLDKVLDWARGYDVDDENDNGSTTDTRPWVLGDILHSQPMVINYGARTGYTEEDPDMRLVVGTNAGMIHMFANDTGEEDWAFFPKELAPILVERMRNAETSQHIYGMDNTPALYIKDVNRNGTIESGDKAYAYFTMRRGGGLVYALDVSDPDNPALLWQLGSSNNGFEELAQTWSKPAITEIPGYYDNNGYPKPVLIFGAGYDTNKDSSGVITDDAVGRGIFIVDAETGALVWSVTPASNSATNMQETGLLHSVAGAVSLLDSNGDGLTDRIYFADTGGNVWRVDLPGRVLPDVNQDTWRIVKLIGVNGSTEATDRRFFNAPDIVRTRYDGVPFDAVLIGSGDRTNPNATDVDNQFYMIRDLQVRPYTTEEPTTSECIGPPPLKDFRCQLPLSVNSLYDVTANPIQNGTTEEQAAASIALAAASGWRLDLEAVGEKSLAKSQTVDGKVYLTTFSPDPGLSNICEPSPGTGRLYAVGLHDARAVADFDGDDDMERSRTIGSLIPDMLSIHVGETYKRHFLLPPGTIVTNPPDGGNSNDNGGAGLLDLGQQPPAEIFYWNREEY